MRKNVTFHDLYTEKYHLLKNNFGNMSGKRGSSQTAFSSVKLKKSEKLMNRSIKLKLAHSIR